MEENIKEELMGFLPKIEFYFIGFAYSDLIFTQKPLFL